jgi:hypothetical protein
VGSIPASLFKVFGVASGVLPPPHRRSSRELGRRREAPTHRCQCRRVPEATRSASLSSTSPRVAARPDPTRVSGRRAPDRERAGRERRPSPPGPDPTPPGTDRGWSLPANDGSRTGSAGIGRASASRPAPGHDPAFLPSQVQDRRALDDESVVREPDLQRGVVEVQWRAMLDKRLQRLIELPAQADDVPTCAQGDPVEVDGRCEAPLLLIHAGRPPYRLRARSRHRGVCLVRDGWLAAASRLGSPRRA